MEFTVVFHSRFRVGDAYPRDGVDLTADIVDPLPADHLKGVMRAAATQLVGWGAVPEDLIKAVFGTDAAPCPWGWSGAHPEAPLFWHREQRHRVAINPATHTALNDMLVAADEVALMQNDPDGKPIPATAATAKFSVRPLKPIPAGGLPQQQALLRLAARNVHHVGGWRRRGLGWVTITPDQSPTVADDLATVGGQP